MVKLISIASGDSGPSLLEFASHFTNRSLTREVDESRKDVRSPSGFFSILRELSKGFPVSANPYGHYFVTFAVQEDKTILLDFMAKYADDLTVSPFESFALLLVSGSLKNWLRVLTESRFNDQLTGILNDIHRTLIACGFEEVFRDCRQRPRSDGNYDLVKV